MARPRNALRQALVVSATWIFFHFTRLLPLPLARLFARSLARIALRLPRLHRVGRKNLDLAYGDTLSPVEKDRILRGAAENMFLVAAEFSRIPLLQRKESIALAAAEGFEHLDPAKGALLISAHLGNWEWMAPVVVREGREVAGVVRPLDAPALNRLIDRTRRSSGGCTIEKDDAGAEMLRYLREHWVVGVLIDQSPRENAVPAQFFGAPCWATIAPVMIAVRARVAIHPTSMTRQPDGRYLLRIQPALELVRTGDLRQDLVENTQRCQNAIEAMVREFPEQWLWFHRRWKPRPRLEQEWQARIERDRKRAGQQVSAAGEPLP